MRMPAALYTGSVTHARFAPKRYRFRYRVFQLLLDIDALDRVDARSRVFSVNRFNLLSFYEKDHGPCDGSSLRVWAMRLLSQHGVDLEGGRIELLCFPRVLGYVFNPLSLWYCWHRDGSLRAIIYEVRNTFGEKHHYLISNDGRALKQGEWWAARKAFHVSPFMPMQAEYRFRISPPGERVHVLIDEYCPADAGMQRTLVAALEGRRKLFTDRALLRAFLSIPLMTIKVIAAIHWQALKLWLRGFRFHRKPAPPDHEVSKTWTMNTH